MEADDHPLEQLLVGLPRGRQGPLAVGGDAADQAVRGDQGAQGAGVDVGAGDVRRAPDLAGRVPRAGGPRSSGEPRRPAVEEDEAARQVVLRRRRLLGPGPVGDADAGLGPVGPGWPVGGVGRLQAEVDLVGTGADLVVDDDPVLQVAAEPEPAAVGVALDQPGRVRDDRLLPVAVGRVGPAERLQVPDLHRAAGHVAAPDRQHVVGPVQGQRRLLLLRPGRRGGGQRDQERDESSHGILRGLEQRDGLPSGL